MCNFLKKYDHLILYVFFGVCTTFINVAIFWLLSHILNMTTIPSTVIAWGIAVSFAYITNRKWVFQSTAKGKTEVLKELYVFFSCRFATGVIDWLCMWLIVDILGLNDILTKISTNVLVILLNYIFSRFMVFGKCDLKNNNIDLKENAKSLWISRISVSSILCILAFIFLMQSPLNIFVTNGNPGTDSSVFKTVALCMDKGLMPYKDSFDHKGPLIYIYNWVGMHIAYWRGIWVIEFISLSVCLFFMYKIARIFCKKSFAVLVVIICLASLYTYFQGGNLTEEYALPFIAGALYFFIDYFINNNISKIRLMLCGLFFGAVCLLRVNMVSVWLVFCIAVLIQCIYLKNLKNCLIFLLWFMIGMFIIFFPVYLWLIINGAFTDFIKDYFVFNSKYIETSGLDKCNSFSFFANNSYVILASIISFYMCKNDKRKIFNISYGVCILVTLIFIGMSGYKYLHYGMLLIPMLVYPISLLLSRKAIKEKSWILALAMYLIITQTVPSWLLGVNRAMECCFQEDESLKQLGAAVEVVEYVKSNSSENEKIIVLGNWDIIYALSRRLPASKYSYQVPIGSVDNKILMEFWEELYANIPKLVIVSREIGGAEQFLIDNEYECTFEIEDVKIYMQKYK